MKTSILLLLFCMGTSFAQSIPNIADQNQPSLSETIEIKNRLLLAKDFIAADGRMVVTEIACQITDGSTTNQFLVSVVCLKNAYHEIGLDRINDIIVMANQKAQGTLAVAHDYVPTEIKIAYNPTIRDWCLTNLYCEKDKEGHGNEKLLAMDFDSVGLFKGMKRIF